MKIKEAKYIFFKFYDKLENEMPKSFGEKFVFGRIEGKREQRSVERETEREEKCE